MKKISVLPYIILTSFVISIESSIAQQEMILVEGGTLPQSSEIAGATVAAFKINKYEVTWAEWLDVRNWALTNGYLDLDGIGVGIDSNNPVTNINWYYAVKWCNAKSEKEGLTPVYKHEGSVYRIGQQTNSPFFPLPGQPTPEPFDVSVDANANGYRLPTEAEWEWAARGGVLSQGTIYSGSNDIETVCWWRGNTIPRGARAVGSKAPNELGIFDMSGNVMEWCWDTVDMGPFMSYPWRRYRGGNFDWYEHECTVSHRRVGDPRYLGDDITGFRLAQSADNDAADSDGDGLSDAWERGFGRYQVIEGNFTWAQADADARSRNGHLATVGSATEWTFIKQLRAGHPYNGFLWLGGTDADSEGLWKWIDGTAWTFEAWGVGEPNNSMEEDRLMMLSATDNYVWNDLHGELDPFGYGTFGYLLEFGYPTDPFKADTDDDGYNDKVESDNGSDPNNAAATPEVTDRDNDGVNYYREIADGTDPTNATSFNALSVGLVAYYPFDGNANDESGYANTGIATVIQPLQLDTLW